MGSLVAINWEFELRGILTVIMGVAVLMGSVYLVLMTTLGARSPYSFCTRSQAAGGSFTWLSAEMSLKSGILFSSLLIPLGNACPMISHTEDDRGASVGLSSTRPI